ncbi:hypothetical protein [Streptomyces sp. 891-h]|uniref:hypothetical protein n=1 Tax=Streptomyces sp. 891-h TaxID=2720714 RepID=UPI001FA9D656|nr:hypothetical protein [Streptomyces sp. 891-h]UNZ16276.1 hypothetical protein HC362_03450 [Streptomyces sp. 891-h]
MAPKDSKDKKKKKKEREEQPVMPGGYPASVASSSGTSRSSRRDSEATTSSRRSERGGTSRRDSEATTSSRSSRSHRSGGETTERRRRGGGSPGSDGSRSSGSSGTDIPALDEAVDRLSELPSSPGTTSSAGSADDLPEVLQDAPQEMPWYHTATQAWHYLRGSNTYTRDRDRNTGEPIWRQVDPNRLANRIGNWARDNATTIGTDIGGAAFAGQGIGILGNPPSAPPNTWGSRMYGLGGVTVNALVPATQLAATPNRTYAHYGMTALNMAGQTAYGIGASGLIQSNRWAWAAQGFGALTSAGATWAYNHLPQGQQSRQQDQGNVLPMYNMPAAQQGRSNLALPAQQAAPAHPAYGQTSTLTYRPAPPRANTTAAAVNSYQPQQQVSYLPSGRGQSSTGGGGYQTSAQAHQGGVQRRNSQNPGGVSYSQQQYNNVSYSNWQNPYGNQRRSPSPGRGGGGGR